jgi:hypothetical protein
MHTTMHGKKKKFIAKTGRVGNVAGSMAWRYNV